MIKRFENFEYPRFSEKDIINAIKRKDYIYVKNIKNLPDHNDEDPVRPLDIDTDGLITIEVDGKDYEVDLKNVIRLDNKITESYYQDLSEYRYDNNFKGLNIGWLDRGHNYEKGETPDSVVEKLKSAKFEKRYKGWHVCEFCKKSTGYGIGSITGKSGTKYVFPDMIIHYIVDHGYKPPTKFIKDVS